MMLALWRSEKSRLVPSLIEQLVLVIREPRLEGSSRVQSVAISALRQSKGEKSSARKKGDSVECSKKVMKQNDAENVPPASLGAGPPLALFHGCRKDWPGQRRVTIVDPAVVPSCRIQLTRHLPAAAAFLEIPSLKDGQVRQNSTNVNKQDESNFNNIS